MSDKNKYAVKDYENLDRIAFSVVAEDFDAVERALQINDNDTVLQIASAGDNIFSSSTRSPEKIYAIDMNPAQIALTELKLKGFEKLDYPQLCELVGVEDSTRRTKIYDSIKNELSINTQKFFEKNRNLIEMGLVYSGITEAIHQPLRIFLKEKVGSELEGMFEEENITKQKEFFEKKIKTNEIKSFVKNNVNSIVVRTLEGIADPNILKNIDENNYTFKCIERMFYNDTLKQNFNAAHILIGRYVAEKPLYLKEENFDKIRKNLSKIDLVTGDVYSFLKKQQESTIDKFDLSDIFEFSTEQEFSDTLKEVVRVGKNGSKVLITYLVTVRNIPSELREYLIENKELQNDLLNQEKTFHSGYHVLDVHKQPTIMDKIIGRIKERSPTYFGVPLG